MSLLVKTVALVTVLTVVLYVYSNFVVRPNVTLRASRSVPLIDQIIRSHAAYFVDAATPEEEQLQPMVPYKNHCYRIYNLALQLYEGGEASLVSESQKELLAVAVAFHDLALFTHKTLDYLDPSADLARKWMESKSYSKDDIAAVSEMIIWHHKVTSYQGPHSEMVERLRKADWADVTLGMRRFEASPEDVRALRDVFPSAGFYWFLVKSESTWLLSHPTNPVPFLRW